MKKSTILFNFFIVLSAVTIAHQPTMQDYDQGLAYFNHYKINPALKELLDTVDLTTIIHRGGLVKILDEYVVKVDISRLEGAEIINKVITDEKLNLLAVPEKKLHHDSSSPFDLLYDSQAIKGQSLYRCSMGRYYVVCKKIIPAQNFILSLQHIKQLVILITKTKFADIKPDNFILADNGILYIIDTQLHGFSKDESLTNLKNWFYRFIRKGKWKEHFTEEAYEYIMQLLSIRKQQS